MISCNVYTMYLNIPQIRALASYIQYQLPSYIQKYTQIIELANYSL